jgi:hypothetical protein
VREPVLRITVLEFAKSIITKVSVTTSSAYSGHLAQLAADIDAIERKPLLQRHVGEAVGQRSRGIEGFAAESPTGVRAFRWCAKP